MKRSIKFVVSLVLALGLSPGMWSPAQAQTRNQSTSKSLNSTAHLLVLASKLARVKINSEEVLSVSRGNETFAAAPIAGWERIPATELRKGVNIAFAYFDTTEPKIPRGYYTLKAFAEVREVGTVDARVQVISRSGRVVAEISAEAEIHSLTVPPEAASRRSFVTTATRAGNAGRPILIWYRCPNGVCIRHIVFLDRL